MFNDFHESTRNVGVVGVLLGFLVLAGFCGLGMAVFNGLSLADRGPSLAVQVATQEGVIEQLDDDLKKTRSRVEELEGFQAAGKLAEKKREEITQENKIVGLHQEKVTELEDLVNANILSFEEYRDRYRQRERSLAKGEIIDLSATKGEEYEACKILSISPLHLRVMRRAGPIGIPYQELPRSVQDRFQFGDQEAELYKQKVAAAEARKGKQIAAFQDKKMAMKKEETIASYKLQINAKTLEITKQLALADQLDASAKDWQRKATEMDRKANAARSSGRITSNPGHARQARNKAANLSKQANNARATAAKLESEIFELEKALEENR